MVEFCRHSFLRPPSILFFVVSSVCASYSTVAHAFDEKKANKTFKKCIACHQVGPDAENTIGPNLNDLNGRVIGSVEGFKYSKAFKKLASEGRVWDQATLDGFLKKPKKYFKGTAMGFGGLRKDEERKNIVEWLLKIPEGKPVTTASLLGVSAAAITGDPEYGQYLSGECVTCHKTDGTSDGIPSVVGWPKENFIDVLYRYKTGERENPVMQTVAKRLGDEEMAALAAYFGSLGNSGSTN